MVATQEHVVPRLKQFIDILFIILTADGEQHAGLLKCYEARLQPEVALRTCHALNTVLAQNSLPQRVVTIDGNNFERRSSKGVDSTSNHGGETGESFSSVGNVTDLIRGWIIDVQQ